VGWVERRWKQGVFIAVLSATVVSTAALAAPALARVPGVDVSKYQGRIDWRAVATTPVRFAVLRATLGNDYRDGRYVHNVAGARRNGLTVGAYHYAKPGLARWDPRVEADHFLDVIGLRAGDVIPVLDIEETGGLGPRQLRTWASAWLERVHERTGVRAMIYSGNFFWRGFMRNTASFARRNHPLWVAHWYVGAPDVPAHRWGGRGYTIWQWSAVGRIAGIHGPVDRDWMDGNLSRGTVASIAVRPAEGGVVTGDRLACGGGEGSCSRLANPGDRIVLRATPEAGARFIRWAGACEPRGEAPTCVVTALGARTVSAVFGGPNEVAVSSARTIPEAPGSSDAASRPGSLSTPTPAPSPAPAPAPEPSPAPAPEPEPSPAPAPEPEPTASPEPTSTPEPTPVPELMSIPRSEPRSPEGDGDGTRFTWSRERVRNSIGGSYRWERRGAASISFGFRGGSVTLFTVEGRRMGRARISVDGEPVKVIDGYARRFRAEVRHRFTDLGAGPHRLTITPLGSKRQGATDRRVTVDALRWGGNLHADPEPEAVSWARVEAPSASEGGYVVSDAPGAQASLRFSGTSLTLMTLRGPTRGQAEIWVDGRRVRTIDLYAPEHGFASVRVASGLAEGPHIARVVVLGTHHRASDGSGVAIDRWVITYRPERGRGANAGGHLFG
jgi:GH25 family lysozyme M1 (1,4-beta-N-acetylmuramidase)